MTGRIVKSTTGQLGALYQGVNYLAMTLVIALFAMGMVVVWSHGPGAIARDARTRERGEKPHSGWLYVVDSKNGSAEGQILLVDPAKGSAVKTFKTGMNPDIALAPDGTRLYIASTYTDGSVNRDELAVVDTTTGAVLQTVDNPGRVSYNVFPPSSAMALSRDGRWLYVMKYETHTIGPEQVLYWIETFDTQTGRFLSEKASLSTCGWGQLTSLKAQQVQVVCEETKDVRLLKITDTGAAAASSVRLNSKSQVITKTKGQTKRSERVAGGFALGDHQIAVMRDGRILKVDAVTSAVNEIGSANVPNDRWVHSLVGAPDRSKVFVALSVPTLGNQGRWAAGEIREVNINDSAELGKIKTSHPFHYLSLSNDNNRLYAMDASGAQLMVIDAAALKEVQTISGLGISPSLVIEAP